MKLNVLLLLLWSASQNLMAEWKAGLAKAGNARAIVTIIPGMGHAATIGSTHAQGGAVMPEYTKAVSAFLGAFKAVGEP